jgi:hypothetical protein
MVVESIGGKKRTGAFNTEVTEGRAQRAQRKETEVSNVDS